MPRRVLTLVALVLVPASSAIAQTAQQMPLFQLEQPVSPQPKKKLNLQKSMDKQSKSTETQSNTVKRLNSTSSATIPNRQ
jgi:hypothetical protein